MPGWVSAAVAVYGAFTQSSANRSAKNQANNLAAFATSGFESPKIQAFLPPQLRQDQIGGILQSGVQGIGDLIKNPGGLAPNVGQAIGPRLAIESENIAQNFRGIRANQAGLSARSNLPVSIRGALSSALDVAQARAQRGARRQALTDTDSLRRQDLGQTFSLLDTLLQFTSSGRGHGIQGLGAAANLNQQNSAANQAFLGSIMSGLASNSGKGQKDVPQIT